MAPLHGALALAEPAHGAVPVGEELDLDVPRPLEVALEEQPAVAEGRQRLAFGRGDGVVELVERPDDPHPAAAAAGRRLDEQRQPELGGRAAGDDRHGGRRGDLLGRHLVARGAQRGRRRPDPREAGVADRGREVRALGEEAVAGVDRIGAAPQSRPHECAGVEVRVDVQALVGAPGVE